MSPRLLRECSFDKRFARPQSPPPPSLHVGRNVPVHARLTGRRRGVDCTRTFRKSYPRTYLSRSMFDASRFRLCANPEIPADSVDRIGECAVAINRPISPRDSRKNVSRDNEFAMRYFVRYFKMQSGASRDHERRSDFLRVASLITTNLRTFHSQSSQVAGIGIHPIDGL